MAAEQNDNRFRGLCGNKTAPGLGGGKPGAGTAIPCKLFSGASMLLPGLPLVIPAFREEHGAERPLIRDHEDYRVRSRLPSPQPALSRYAAAAICTRLIRLHFVSDVPKTESSNLLDGEDRSILLDPGDHRFENVDFPTVGDADANHFGGLGDQRATQRNSQRACSHSQNDGLPDPHLESVSHLVPPCGPAQCDFGVLSNKFSVRVRNVLTNGTQD